MTFVARLVLWSAGLLLLMALGCNKAADCRQASAACATGFACKKQGDRHQCVSVKPDKKAPAKPAPAPEATAQQRASATQARTATVQDVASLLRDGKQAIVDGDPVTARKKLSECLEIKPDELDCRWELGWAHWKAEDWKQVVATWKRVAQERPADKSVQKWLSIAKAKVVGWEGRYEAHDPSGRVWTPDGVYGTVTVSSVDGTLSLDHGNSCQLHASLTRIAGRPMWRISNMEGDGIYCPKITRGAKTARLEILSGPGTSAAGNAQTIQIHHKDKLGDTPLAGVYEYSGE